MQLRVAVLAIERYVAESVTKVAKYVNSITVMTV